MVQASIYNLIIVLSTDYFNKYLFSKEENINIIKVIARKMIKIILNGGNNYYMSADYNIKTIAKIEKMFYEELKYIISPLTIKKIKEYQENIISTSKISDDVLTAKTVIITKAANFYWLETEFFSQEISNELLEICIIIEPYEIDTEEYPCDEDDWIESKSQWDQYLISLMDGIDGAPFTIFQSIYSDQSNFYFMKVWKNHLTNQQFQQLKYFIAKESIFELKKYNIEASKKIIPIMKFI